tara:strand:- start:12320 stop:13057 length:738 start_codon:yes stop_codon:yes gene_type:complete
MYKLLLALSLAFSSQAMASLAFQIDFSWQDQIRGQENMTYDRSEYYNSFGQDSFSCINKHLRNLHNEELIQAYNHHYEQTQNTLNIGLNLKVSNTQPNYCDLNPAIDCSSTKGFKKPSSQLSVSINGDLIQMLSIDEIHDHQDFCGRNWKKNQENLQRSILHYLKNQEAKNLLRQRLEKPGVKVFSEQEARENALKNGYNMDISSQQALEGIVGVYSYPEASDVGLNEFAVIDIPKQESHNPAAR